MQAKPVGALPKWPFHLAGMWHAQKISEQTRYTDIHGWDSVSLFYAEEEGVGATRQLNMLIISKV